MVMKGATYLVTRRCTQRQFLLRPCIETNRIFLYCLCYAAQQTGVEVHGVVTMSNHWHGVVTDPDARLPEFLQILHRLIAVATNALLGQASLRCTLPPMLRHLRLDGASRRLRALTQEGVRRARRTVRSQGRNFLGADGVRTMPIYRHATTPEPLRKRRPAFASRDPGRLVAAIRRLSIFRAAYRIAFGRWQAGQRTVRFPEGTYQMRVLHLANSGTSCVEKPASWRGYAAAPRPRDRPASLRFAGVRLRRLDPARRESR